MRTSAPWACVLGSVLLACSSKPTCPAGDLECLTDSLVVSDVDSSDDNAKRQQLKVVNTEAFFAARDRQLADGGANQFKVLKLEANGSLTFESGEDHGVLLAVWSDPMGCRPALCFTPCPKNARCLGSTRCGPMLADGLTSGSTFHRIEYAKAPAAAAGFDLGVTPVSAQGCPGDVTTLIESDAAALRVGETWKVSVTIPGTGGAGGGSGGGSGGGCLQASTRVCTPLGTDGVTSTCIDPAQYAKATGKTLPAACAPEGTTGCQDSAGSLVKPCCEGLTCRVSSQCGGGSTLGGVCLP